MANAVVGIVAQAVVSFMAKPMTRCVATAGMTAAGMTAARMAATGVTATGVTTARVAI
jgi:hypothetical protein